MTGIEIYQIVSGAVLTIAISIISFWLVRFVNSIDALAATIRKIELAQTGNDASCTEKHKVINYRFKDNDGDLKEVHEQLNDHETRISVIESKK